MAIWATSVEEAIANVQPGQTVALGGFLNSRHPMALVRALVRRGIRDLTIVTPGGGVDVDLLIAAGCVRQLILGVVSLDLVGPAPAFRRAAEAGTIKLLDTGTASMARSLEAAHRGLASLPARLLAVSEVRARHPGRPDIEDPEVLHMPALRPDVALIHADRADFVGNVRLAAPALDGLLASAAGLTIVSVEQVVASVDLAATGTAGIPRNRVSCLVRAPLGAYPTSCYPDYGPDYLHIIEYARAVEDNVPLQDVLARFVAPDELQYRTKVGVEALLRVRQFTARGGMLAWSAPSTS